MRGAMVFLLVFIILLAATLAYPYLPPGRAIYHLLGIPETEYPVFSVPATLLIEAVLNGVVYGVAAWIIFTVADKVRRKGRGK